MRADERTSEAADSAAPATNGGTETIQFRALDDEFFTALKSSDTTEEFLNSVGAGYGRTERELVRMYRTYNLYAAPSRRSTKRYARPKNVREFAAQANSVATAILNGDIDLDTARAYSSVVRTVAQAISADTARSRFLKTAPDLDFPILDED